MSKPGTNPAQRVVLEGYIGGMNRELDARKRQINEFEEDIKQVDKQISFSVNLEYFSEEENKKVLNSRVQEKKS